MTMIATAAILPPIEQPFVADPSMFINENLSTDFTSLLPQLSDTGCFDDTVDPVLTTTTAKHPLLSDDNDTDHERPLKRQVTSEEESISSSSPEDQDDQQQYTRVQCRARGLSNTHNVDTAYFEIPHNAPHGLLLCCTHPECQASGRKFRYCKVCDLPVAKRNFLRRHGHGLVDSNQVLKDEVDNARIKFVERTGCLPCNTMTAIKSSHRRQVSFGSSSSSSSSSSSEEQQQEAKVGLSTFEQEWISLLHDRPEVQEKEKMSAWMSKVMKLANDHQEKAALSTNSSVPPVVLRSNCLSTTTPQTVASSSSLQGLVIPTTATATTNTTPDATPSSTMPPPAAVATTTAPSPKPNNTATTTVNGGGLQPQMLPDADFQHLQGLDFGTIFD